MYRMFLMVLGRSGSNQTP